MCFGGAAGISKSQASELPLQPVSFFYVGGNPQEPGWGQDEQASKSQGERNRSYLLRRALWRGWPPCQNKLLQK